MTVGNILKMRQYSFMLKHLTVQDFALVEHLDLDLGKGLTVITGESGAGKSILLAALSLVLGERASTDVVRPGASRADVHAEFDLTGEPTLMDILRDLELDDPDQAELCLVRRTVSADGRSRAFINGAPVTLQVLRSITGSLVDIHGQHANLRLADRAVQLALLDDFAGTSKLAGEVAQVFRSMQAKQKEAHALRTLLERDADRAELLRYQLEELDNLDLQPGELEKLEVEHKRLSQVDAYQSVVQNSMSAIEELDALRSAGRRLAEVEDDHSGLISAQQTLSDALDLLEDAQSELRRYSEALESDPERLRAVDERLSDIHSLARKHQTPPQVLIDLTESLNAELEGMVADSSALDTITAEIDKLNARFRKSAEQLSRKRKKAAKQFHQTVTETIHQLALPQAGLDARFTETEGESGIDRYEFWVTTNPRYPAGPLHKIASGGELARISLAIQVTAARTSNLPCLVLDEADVGVGGTTADTIGRMLRDLGAHSQVLCVTHAPQVAALGNQHLKVRKTENQDTEIIVLKDSAREDEIARMLAGADVTDKTRAYAAELLAQA